jgi:hypothetical protein
MSSDTPKPVKSTSRKRLYFLVGVMIFELVCYWSLKEFGWLGTGNRFLTLAALLFMGLPILVGVFLLILSRFRFGLKTLFAFCILSAFFLWLSILPLLRHNEARKGASSLKKAKAEVRSFFDKYDWTERMDLPFERPTESDRSLPPSWIATVDQRLVSIPEDEFVTMIELSNLEQVEAYCQFAPRFSSLLGLSLERKTANGDVTELARAIQNAKHLRLLYVTGDVPNLEILKAARGVQSLNIASTSGVAIPCDDAFLEAIGSMSQLVNLSLVEIDLDKRDLTPLRKLNNLKRLNLNKCSVSADSFDLPQSLLGNLKITIQD